MSVSTCKKAINFDLDTNALKINYGGSNYREAYIDIETFMEHNGFEHRQWSGYFLQLLVKIFFKMRPSALTYGIEIRYHNPCKK